jgi:hypothetical protein
MTVKPTVNQLNAGFDAGRKALNDYSEFDSSMVPDAALLTFVTAVATAILNVQPVTETDPNA